MSELALKSAKASNLPSLAGSIYYNRNGMGDELMHMQYFPYSAAALPAPDSDIRIRTQKCEDQQGEDQS
jgi:hypothetical protein